MPDYDPARDDAMINRGPKRWDDLGVSGPMEWLRSHPGATSADLADAWNQIQLDDAAR